MELSRNFSLEKERLERLSADIQKQVEELDARLEAGDNRRALIDQYTDPERLTREMVEILIDYISVGKRPTGAKNPPVEIHWNF